LRLDEREFHRIVYEAGIKTIRHEIKSKVIANKQLSQNEQVEIIRRGLREVGDHVSHNLISELETTRKAQTEKSPSNPKKPFPKNLLHDLNDSMDHICDIQDGEKYELKFYSTSGSKLDFACGFDCWVEIYDLEKNKVLGDVKIDIKTKPGEFPHGLADLVYYFDSTRYLNENDKNKINMDYRYDSEYLDLVAKSARILMKKANIKKPD
jgi:hypothetical protein